MNAYAEFDDLKAEVERLRAGDRDDPGYPLRAERCYHQREIGRPCALCREELRLLLAPNGEALPWLAGFEGQEL